MLTILRLLLKLLVVRDDDDAVRVRRGRTGCINASSGRCDDQSIHRRIKGPRLDKNPNLVMLLRLEFLGFKTWVLCEVYIGRAFSFVNHSTTPILNTIQRSRLTVYLPDFWIFKPILTLPTHRFSFD